MDETWIIILVMLSSIFAPSFIVILFYALCKSWCFFFLIFSIDKVPRITSPVLVIHGTEDEVIDFSHGLTIYERCPHTLAPLWIEGAGHNDVELYSQYLERLKQLINVDLAPKCPQTDLP